MNYPFVNMWLIIGSAVMAFVVNTALILYTAWQIRDRLNRLEHTVTNGLSATVQQIHDDVLVIKAKCPLCSEVET